MTGETLVSPPVGRTRYAAYLLASSSPDLPALTEVIAKNPRKPPLRSGSRALPIPDDAITTFSSAASVWRSQKPDLAVTDPVPVSKRPRTKAADTRKADLKTSKPTVRAAPPEPCDPHPETPPKAMEGLTTKKSPEVIMVASSSPLAAKPWKRFKPSPTTVVGQNKADLPEVEITKPAQQLKRRRKSETVSRHFPPAPGQQDIVEPEAPGEADTIPLEPALARRLDWTPPQADTVARLVPHSPNAREIGSSQGFSPLAAMQGDVFKSLRETYAHKIEGEVLDDTPAMEATSQPPKKRRAVGSTGPKEANHSRRNSPVKSKAPKKKPRTLTELATAAYAMDPETGGDTGPIGAAASRKAKADSVFDILALDGGDVVCQPGHPATKPRKGTKIAKSSKKKAPATLRRNVLLSPSSAMQVSSRQDFVFGTSSQLAREQSPTLLREIHAAMRASNHSTEVDPFASPDDSTVATKRSKPGAKLWSAAARGSDGELLNIEIIDLVDSPSFPDDPLEAACPTASVEQTIRQDQSSPRVADMEMSEPDVFGSPTLNVGRRKGVDQPGIRPDDGDSHPLAACESDVRDCDPGTAIEAEPPPSNQEASIMSSQRAEVSSARHIGGAQPRYELFTDAQLSREVSSYGFKAIKKRSAMIALLQQCWTSQTKGAVQSSTQAAGLSTSAPTSHPRGKKSGAAGTTKKARGSPTRTTGRHGNHDVLVDDKVRDIAPQAKRPRGRPRKASEAAATELPPTRAAETGGPQTPHAKKAKSDAIEHIEIGDSASEGLFSSPDGTFSSPAPIDLSLDAESDMSLAMSPTSQQSALFGYISKAITTTPRSSDPLKPSWHEKILMYDTIILEDLAAWLNAGQLDKVGCDCEVSPFDVKRWCESKSVCCVWRVNLHGVERKRV